MKKLYFLFTALLIGSVSYGQTLLEDDFDYGASAGDLTTISGGNWVNHSGSTTVLYDTSSLTMVNYPSSGVGGSATITGSNSEDVNRTFTEQTSGTIYFSALVSISAVGSGNYFFHLKDTGNQFRARIGAKDDGSGKILFGIGATSSTLSYGTTPFDLNTTYLIVGSFNIDTGLSNLYILSSHSATEPGVPEATNTSANTAAMSAVAFRQSSNIPVATIDGVRVGTTWNNTVVSTVLNTKNNQIEGFSMYPNPTNKGYVNISSRSNSNMEVSVYDILGKQVINATVTNKRLDVSNLNTGVYIMRVAQDEASITKKLVIQ
ncbi:T9SS type A sorting domain-containing protein [Hwangdonia lutea]|uniref:T9SS type A sorting domain-containing protein n=1 Tax=Hwangdonia lutea TaxID=3075823 RepID=A0AA97HT46_9FLAO|nr:T9SS type A sorting domain-containing protein [Hwangdonia sp. SCSIO 19198]WOD45153.1 T9SS type A sorting domain-containing protein [Hwangdonia sp. SCSIO 19198]